MEIDQKGSGDDEEEGDRKRDGGRTADTREVPCRTGPSRTRPFRSPREDRTSVREEPNKQVRCEFGFACGGLLLHAESSNCRKGSDDRVRGFPQQRVVFLRCDVGAAVRAALKVGERTA